MKKYLQITGLMVLITLNLSGCQLFGGISELTPDEIISKTIETDMDLTSLSFKGDVNINISQNTTETSTGGAMADFDFIIAGKNTNGQTINPILDLDLGIEAKFSGPSGGGDGNANILIKFIDKTIFLKLKDYIIPQELQSFTFIYEPIIADFKDVWIDFTLPPFTQKELEKAWSAENRAKISKLIMDTKLFEVVKDYGSQKETDFYKYDLILINESFVSLLEKMGEIQNQILPVADSEFIKKTLDNLNEKMDPKIQVLIGKNDFLIYQIIITAEGIDDINNTTLKIKAVFDYSDHNIELEIEKPSNTTAVETVLQKFWGTTFNEAPELPLPEEKG